MPGSVPQSRAIQPREDHGTARARDSVNGTEYILWSGAVIQDSETEEYCIDLVWHDQAQRCRVADVGYGEARKTADAGLIRTRHRHLDHPRGEVYPYDPGTASGEVDSIEAGATSKVCDCTSQGEVLPVEVAGAVSCPARKCVGFKGGGVSRGEFVECPRRARDHLKAGGS
jgi:hypothetical protein